MAVFVGSMVAALPAPLAGANQEIVSGALAIAIILVTAKLAGEAAVRLGQPAVLGELLGGIALGGLTLVGFHGVDWIKDNQLIEFLAEIGVLILLFEVGVESTVGQMLRVGWVSLAVAIIGVVVPFGLGWGVGRIMLPESSPYVWAFLGATLCATSVGITARVLQDLGRSLSTEARIILGAAVIDDVLGLIVLTVVTGAIAAAAAGGTLGLASIGVVVGKAGAFLFGAIVLGVMLSPVIFRAAARLRAGGALIATSLTLCFALAWASATIGLAPIVGAFAAGLVLEELHSREFIARGEPDLLHLLKPLAGFLVPIFFILMGMRTDLSVFLQPGVLGLAAALTVTAIIGKQACSLGVWGVRADRITIGLGMIPRGEVGLIFANVGAALTVNGAPVVSASTYAAVVAMVVLTTLVTPPALKWSLGRGGPQTPAPA